MKKQLVLAIAILSLTTPVKSSEAAPLDNSSSFYSTLINLPVKLAASAKDDAIAITNNICAFVTPKITALKAINLEDCKQYISKNQENVRNVAIIVASVAIFYTAYKISQKNKTKKATTDCTVECCLQ